MLVVNIFGGPGAGKSTIAAGVFSEIKQLGIETEYIPEFAKVLAWSNRILDMRKQLYVFAKQEYMLETLRQQPLDVVVTDAPLPTSLAYVTHDYYTSFPTLVMEVFNRYKNMNFFLEHRHPYSQVGRIQDREAAHAVAKRVREMLEERNIPYMSTANESSPIDFILEKVLNELRMENAVRV